MAKHLRLILMFLFYQCVAQTPSIRRADFDVPEGSIFGAALASDGNILFVQQYLINTTGELHQPFIRLSSWNTKSRTMVTSASYPERKRAHTVPCRRTLIDAKSGHVYTCSNRTSIQSFDGRSLALHRTIEPRSGGDIRDFALDEAHDRLFVLAEHADGGATLESLSLATGAPVKETTLREGELAYSPLSFRSAGGVVAIAFTTNGGFGQKTVILFYDGSTLASLRKVTNLPRIDAMLFSGSNLLAAPGYAGVKKQGCILSINPQTAEVKRDFCSPHTGVDFSLAVVSGMYLIAGTGVNRPKLFSDVIESVSSSISVWDMETHKMLQTSALPSNFTSALSGLTILGSEAGCFVAFQSAGVSPKVINGCFDPTP